MRKAFTIRNVQLAYHVTSKRLVNIIPALFIGFVILAHGQNLYHLWKVYAAPQSNNEAERINFVLSNYIQLDTLQAAPTENDFSSIALAGSNIGGAVETLADQQLTSPQYTVQPGDTLSGIASKYNLHSASLILANTQLDGNADMLHIGEVLTVPAQDATDTQIQQVYAAAQKATAQKVTTTKASNVATSKVKPSTSTRPSNFIEPVSYRYVSQGFNLYVHPGEDLVANVGTPIKAIADGCITIEATGWNGGYGTFIMLNVGNGYEARYAHLSGFINGMGVGSCVTQGTVIGYSGDTGNSTGPHVHFEIRLNGVPINPNM